MKKFIAFGIAAAGLVWALGKRSGEGPTDTWSAATDRL
jgi:hypothetical protein